MHTRFIERWQHDHVFGQDQETRGERRTRMVVALTASTMVLEIIGGLAFGSMALLADGVHMASHAMALGISVFAYGYVRRHAGDKRFSFGSGNINSLAGFASALLLGVFALWMAVESLERLWNPVSIAFDAAIGVAVLGLVVNGVSMFLLADRQHGHHHHDDDHHHHDHNLRSAYLHVLADTLTSVLAIIALLAGRYMGWVWLDPVMGLVGAALITRWAWGLVKDTGRVLLGYQAPAAHVDAVKQSLERVDSNAVTDLHLWAIGPGIYALSAAIVTHAPRPIGAYRELLPKDLGIVHTTFEIHPCEGNGTGCQRPATGITAVKRWHGPLDPRAIP